MIDMATKSLAPSDTMCLFVENVNAIIEARGITKSQLARDCDMHAPGIRALLNGRSGSCTFATADKIANALDLSVIDILNGAYD